MIGEQQHGLLWAQRRSPVLLWTYLEKVRGGWELSVVMLLLTFMQESFKGGKNQQTEWWVQRTDNRSRGLGAAAGRSWTVELFFSLTFILCSYTLSTKLGKEVNSNKRGLECTCILCQALEKRYSLHWASGSRALGGDVISRSTVSVCFTSIICDGSAGPDRCGFYTETHFPSFGVQ